MGKSRKSAVAGMIGWFAAIVLSAQPECDTCHGALREQGARPRASADGSVAVSRGRGRLVRGA